MKNGRRGGEIEGGKRTEDREDQEAGWPLSGAQKEVKR